MLDQLLGDKKSVLIGALTSKLGVNDSQAGGFLDKLMDMVGGLLKGGDLDVKSLVSGDLSGVKDKLDLGVLGSLLGGGADKAEQGLGAIASPLKDAMGGLDDAEGMIGGLLGADKGGALGGLKGIAGKFLGG